MLSATAARATAVVEKGRSAEVEVDEAAEVGGGKRDEGVAGRAEVDSGRCGGALCGCAAARRPGAGGRAAMMADVEDLGGDEARWTVGDGLGATRGACRCRLQAQQRRELGIALNESCRERGRRGREPPSASADDDSLDERQHTTSRFSRGDLRTLSDLRRGANETDSQAAKKHGEDDRSTSCHGPPLLAPLLAAHSTETAALQVISMTTRPPSPPPARTNAPRPLTAPRPRPPPRPAWPT